MSRIRNFVFTVNATDGEDLRLLDPTHFSWRHVKYVIYQREMGTHEHFQGYIELEQGLTYDQLHQFEGLEGAHFERRRGTAKQARHYCEKPVEGCDCPSCDTERRAPTKLEGPFIWGEPSHQGQRAELLEIQRELHRPEASLKRVAEDHFGEWVKFNKAFAEYRRKVVAKPRSTKTRVFLFVGPPGRGKSTIMRLIAERVFQMDYYKVPAPKGSGIYFDDYDHQPIMIIDEFDGDWMKPKFFNLLADEHECVLPVHGGAGHQMTSKFLFIGSNYAPVHWWKKRSPVQLAQTTRRIDVTFKMLMSQEDWENFKSSRRVHCLQCLRGGAVPCPSHHT